MHLVNGRIRIDIDETTGVIASIRDTVNGLEHLDVPGGGFPDGRLFRLNVPSEDWTSRYTDCHEQGALNVSRQNGGIAIHCPDLHAATGESLGIAATVRLTPGPGKDEVGFSLAIENRGNDTVNEVRFPWLGGWRGLGGPGRDRFTIGARDFFDPASLPAPCGNTYALNAQRRKFYYPLHLFAPWIDISGPAGGLSYILYLARPRNGALSIENLAGYEPGLRLGIGWCHFAVVRPGETWTSPRVGIAVHGSDWHATADRFREWYAAHGPTAAPRPRLRSMIGFQNVFFTGFDGTPIRPLEEIPEVAAIGRRYGVDHLCVWEARSLGNYINKGGSELLDYPPAMAAQLAAGLRRAEAEGTHTSALVNFRHPNVRGALDSPSLPMQIKRAYDGTATVECWSGSHHHAGLWTPQLGPQSYVYSPFSSAHRERVGHLTQQYLDLGYSSIFYDQPFEYLPDYGDDDPEDTYAAALDVIGLVRKQLLARDPDALVIGEECEILAGHVVDLWMSWRISLPEVAPEIVTTRYGIPDAMLSWTIDSEPERAALAFAMGMYLCLMVHGGEATLADEPELATLVGSLATLRQTTAARTANARFVDRRGLTVDGDERLVAHSYASPAGPAVIVAAPGTAAGGRLQIARDAFTNSGSGDGVLHRLDGSSQALAGDELDVKLAANEVAVWTL